MGVSTDANTDADLSAIYQGGDNFLARMKAMTDQRSAIERMLAELNLGRAAREAYDDAAKLQAAATAELTAAKDTAASIVKTANEAATKTRSDADTYAAAQKAKVAEQNAAADAARKAADQLQKDAAEIQSNLSRYKTENEAVKREAQAIKDRAANVLTILKDAVAKASAA